MTLTIPDGLPLIRGGPGQSPTQGGCLVQLASYLRDGSSWVDNPAWLHPGLRWLGIFVNDRVSDWYRPELGPLAADLAGTDPEPAGLAGRVLRVRLATWTARQVSDLWREEDREQCRAAVDAAEAWALCPCTRHLRRVVEVSGRAAMARAYVVDAGGGRTWNVADAAAGAAHTTYSSTGVSIRVATRARGASAGADRDYVLHELLRGAISEYRRCTSPTVPSMARWGELCDLLGTTSRDA